MIQNKTKSNGKDPSFDIDKVIEDAKKTVIEKALATVEESQIEEKGDGGQEFQVGGATASTAAASANTVPSATTNADANPNGDAAVPAETDNAIAPSGESNGSNGGLDNESDAALAEDNDDDGDFPMANEDDDEAPDQEAQLITNDRYDLTT